MLKLFSHLLICEEAHLEDEISYIMLLKIASSLRLDQEAEWAIDWKLHTCISRGTILDRFKSFESLTLLLMRTAH